jgi:crotonobetainyl-CoA:carnitine CoA-transferase CaiB-like acyl-CoA transferase
LIDVLGARELNEDERFSSNAKRIANLPALCAALETHFRRDGADAWIARLEAAGVPVGRILSIAEMHAHPQTLARNMVIESEHAQAGPVKALGAPVKFGDSPAGRSRPAPMLGEHTREILSEIGYAAGEIETLIETGAAVAS